MKILVATDGSRFSNAAIEEICRMGMNPEKMEIEVVSVFTPPLLTGSAPYEAVYAGYSPEIEAELREAADEATKQAEEKLAAKFPALHEKITLKTLYGSPERAIVEEAESWGAELIVVGSHGYGFWERMFLGSVSNAIVHHAPCSVLVVRSSKNQEKEMSEN